MKLILTILERMLCKIQYLVICLSRSRYRWQETCFLDYVCRVRIFESFNLISSYNVKSFYFQKKKKMRIALYQYRTKSIVYFQAIEPTWNLNQAQKPKYLNLSRLTTLLKDFPFFTQCKHISAFRRLVSF